MTVSKRTDFFFSGVLTLTGDYAGNSFDLPQCKHIRIAVSSGTGDNAEFSLIGPRSDIVDGKVLAGENIPFDGLSAAKISLRGQGTARVWAY